MSVLARGTSDILTERVFPTPHQYMDDPVGWVQDRLREELWSKQRDILCSVNDHRYTAVHSCHDSGKSYTAARAAAWWLDVHELGEAFVVTTAPTWRQVKAILWREMRRAHRKAELNGRTTLDCEWYMGGSGRPGNADEELVAMGRKPNDYDPDAFQGIHAKYVLVIVDEASGIPRALYDAVDSLVTNEHARVLAIGNPDDPASHFETVCRPGSGWQTIHISYDDTPNFTGEVEELRTGDQLRDLLISPTWVDERRERWGESSPTFISKVLGQFPEISDDTLISPSSLRAAQNRELAPKGAGIYGYDIARLGSDETVGYRNRRGHIRCVYSRRKQRTMTTAGAIKLEVGRHQGGAHAWIDVVGLGAGVYDRCREWRLAVHPFNGAERPQSSRFGNRRAEVYWNFKDGLERGLYDLPAAGEDDDLYAQLGAIKWVIKNGRIYIESKDAMRKRGLPSPDRADACVMAAINDGIGHVPKRETRRRTRDEIVEGAIDLEPENLMTKSW